MPHFFNSLGQIHWLCIDLRKKIQYCGT